MQVLSQNSREIFLGLLLYVNKISDTHRIIGKPFSEQAKTKVGKELQFIPQAVEKTVQDRVMDTRLGS